MKIQTTLALIAIATSATAQRPGNRGEQPERPEGRQQPDKRERPLRPVPSESPGETERPQTNAGREARTTTGYGNNPISPELGTPDRPVNRMFENDYADGLGSPSGESRPSARAISNAIAIQTESIPNKARATDFLWQWGQFLDHYIVETPTISPAESFDILVPTGDPWFDPFSTGIETIPMNRSFYEVIDDVREQVNGITAFIDASQVYGSDDERSDHLRKLDGSGELTGSSS